MTGGCGRKSEGAPAAPVRPCAVLKGHLGTWYPGGLKGAAGAAQGPPRGRPAAGGPAAQPTRAPASAVGGVRHG